MANVVFTEPAEYDLLDIEYNIFYNVTGRTSPSQVCDLGAFLYQPELMVDSYLE